MEDKFDSKDEDSFESRKNFLKTFSKRVVRILIKGTHRGISNRFIHFGGGNNQIRNDSISIKIDKIIQ